MAAAATDKAYRKRFEEWMKQNNKEYSSLEETEARFSAFKHNIRIIEAHNARKEAMAAAASDEADWKRFEEWMKKYNKEYSSEEEKEARFSAFKENLRNIEANMAEYPNDKHWQGLNCYADMTVAQFLTEHMGIDFGAREYYDSEEDDDKNEALIKATFESDSEDEDDDYDNDDVKFMGDGQGEVLVKHKRVTMSKKDAEQLQGIANVAKI